MVKIFGPNWKTSITGVGSAIISVMTLLALMPQDTGLQFIPEPYRTYAIKAGIASAFILRILNALSQKDAHPTVVPPPAPPAPEDK